MTRAQIEDVRNIFKPWVMTHLYRTNKDGKGLKDALEFERDFDEILDLALIGMKHQKELGIKENDDEI